MSKKILSVNTKVLGIMWLPPELMQLIKSFLPRPVVPYVQIPTYFSYDYMCIEDWNDTDDIRAYGDF